MTLKWYGGNIKHRIDKATADAMNEVVAATMIHALNNHPNWKYQTGIAEGSIQVKEPATPKNHKVLWGSIWTTMKGKLTNAGKSHTTNYVWYLEFKHGPFLRAAADVVYPQLSKRIKARLR